MSRSPPHTELSLDHQYSPPPLDESFQQYYNAYSSLVVPIGPAPDFYTSEDLYVDGIYHWVDASPARPDTCVTYPLQFFYPSTLSSEAIPLSDYCSDRHVDFEEPSQPSAGHGHSYISHLAQQFRNTSTRPQAQDHRSTIARASDNFLAHASSIFSDGHSPSRRRDSLEYRTPTPSQTSLLRDTRPSSRKRSRESLDDTRYPIKEEDDNACSPSLPGKGDTPHLSGPHMSAPSHGLPPSSARIPNLGDAATSLNAQSHTRSVEPRLRPEERCMAPLPRQTSNKRVHRSSDHITRQESTILSTSTTWPIHDDPLTKSLKRPGEQKKQALACLFCRERKIACGRPPAYSADQTCNQCSRRRIKCEYPTESRRGQHKRRRKPLEGEPSTQCMTRTTATPEIPTTNPSSMTSTTVTPPT